MKMEFKFSDKVLEREADIIASLLSDGYLYVGSIRVDAHVSCYRHRANGNRVRVEVVQEPSGACISLYRNNRLRKEEHVRD